MKDYRKLYKKHYEIDFGKDFDIHHIDFDRTNNNIDNLILLPKSLHHKYHLCINSINKELDFVINCQYSQTFYIKMLKNFCDVMEEIEKWKLYKIQLDMAKMNEVE